MLHVFGIGGVEFSLRKRTDGGGTDMAKTGGCRNDCHPYLTEVKMTLSSWLIEYWLLLNNCSYFHGDKMYFVSLIQWNWCVILYLAWHESYILIIVAISDWWLSFLALVDTTTSNIVHQFLSDNQWHWVDPIAVSVATNLTPWFNDERMIVRFCVFSKSHPPQQCIAIALIYQYDKNKTRFNFMKLKYL